VSGYCGSLIFPCSLVLGLVIAESLPKRIF